MKFLEITSFAQICQHLTDVVAPSGELLLNGKLEGYSCKTAGSDKKLFRSMEEQFQVELSKSPGDEELLSSSPFGPLTLSSSRKTLMYLVAIMNASFPDYDFSSVQPEQFKKEDNYYAVINSINTILAGVIDGFTNYLAPHLWQSLETEVSLKECDIYSYTPDEETDPYEGDDYVWALHYFFYNRRLRRIAYLSAKAVRRPLEQGSSSATFPEEGLWDDEMII
eukprot:TRINITY_DN6568_c0_g1_i1.p1 TRINITY_DN6568_c0_g1~~TRINITY_DN6568_c0_g1_i1.p1  ORF type:complete len:223 (-),score=37.16 TRINITY_DN6568_c0_g1_i1:132-800(-)